MRQHHFVYETVLCPGEEECVEVIRSTSSGSPAYVEHLSLKEVEKIPVVLCTTTVESWVRQQISQGIDARIRTDAVYLFPPAPGAEGNGEIVFLPDAAALHIRTEILQHTFLGRRLSGE